jgi:hypothetical protein
MQHLNYAMLKRNRLKTTLAVKTEIDNLTNAHLQRNQYCENCVRPTSHLTDGMTNAHVRNCCRKNVMEYSSDVMLTVNHLKMAVAVKTEIGNLMNAHLQRNQNCEPGMEMKFHFDANVNLMTYENDHVRMTWHGT